MTSISQRPCLAHGKVIPGLESYRASVRCEMVRDQDASYGVNSVIGLGEADTSLLRMPMLILLGRLGPYLPQILS